MKRSTRLFLFFALVFLGAGSINIKAQVVPSAFRKPFSLTAGGMVSGFQPNYGPNKLLGMGAYVDLNLFHGVGIEAEGRWLRFHSYQNITQDNYLIGPRVKVLHFWRAQPYVKVLVGFGKMNFENNIATGRFTDISYGGGVDLRVTRRITLRAVDLEYQQWPKFLSSSLYPYGASMGIGYRIF